MIKILFLGDIFGKTGRDAVIENLSELKKEYEIDYVIAKMPPIIEKLNSISPYQDEIKALKNLK